MHHVFIMFKYTLETSVRIFVHFKNKANLRFLKHKDPRAQSLTDWGTGKDVESFWDWSMSF